MYEYDSNVLLTEDHETSADADDQVHQAQHEDPDEDEMFETLLAEGDNDSAFVADYEAAASEVLQSDEELSTAYTAYIEARRKLNEKYRARGFFSIGKGCSKFGKGKAKGRSSWSRKSLQHRILDSHCRYAAARAIGRVNAQTGHPTHRTHPNQPQLRCQWHHLETERISRCQPSS